MNQLPGPIENCGFLGMDNVSCVNRSLLPPGCSIRQADAAAWLAFNALHMMEAAFHLSQACDEFVDDFIHIAEQLNGLLHYISKTNNDDLLSITGLWCSEDNFFYDVLTDQHGENHVLRIQSMVGLLALIACKVFSKNTWHQLSGSQEKMKMLKNYMVILSYCN
jgi:hypothetical protein